MGQSTGMSGTAVPKAGPSFISSSGHWNTCILGRILSPRRYKYHGNNGARRPYLATPIRLDHTCAGRFSGAVTKPMLSYVTIGANDVRRSERFYTAILCPLGYERTLVPGGAEYSRPDGKSTIYVRHAFDGRPATPGNGSMLAFKAATQQHVRELHAAGRDAGGSDEGAPGFRDEYGEHFYVAYLRDDVGNKIALFCNDPSEPGRGS